MCRIYHSIRTECRFHKTEFGENAVSLSVCPYEHAIWAALFLLYFIYDDVPVCFFGGILLYDKYGERLYSMQGLRFFPFPKGGREERSK